MREYGIDWCGPAVIEVEENAGVQVPSIQCPLQPHELAILQTLVDPLDDSDDMGVGSYAATKQFVEYCQSQRI